MLQNCPFKHAINHIKHSTHIKTFQKYFLHSKENFSELKKLIKQCNVDDIHCRFSVWRLVLGIVGVESNEQTKRIQLEESRRKYQQKKQQALKIFKKKSPVKQQMKKNPLLIIGCSKPQQSKEIQTDEFLKEEIRKDVERTYQQMLFFQDKTIIKLLNLLLFVWCRRNPDVSYQQGMNQLLAPVVICYFKQAEFRSLEERPEHIDQKLWSSHLYFNSVEYAQSDIFSVFEKIIDIQADMYKTQADVNIKSKVNPNSKNNTPILQRIMQIKDHKLKHLDIQLFRIIKLQDVQTKSFMLRWIRCMHTREFDLDNSFVIWDSIFLEYFQYDNSKKNKQFQFIDAMCLAMFMYMRSIVFTKETAGEILQLYQKYPSLKRGAYLDELIALAWNICEQLRILNQSIQSSQSNWFEESQKVKSLHFIQKKSLIKPIKSEVKTETSKLPKKEFSEKQLIQTDHNKQPQLIKITIQQAHSSRNHKLKHLASSPSPSLSQTSIQKVHQFQQSKTVKKSISKQKNGKNNEKSPEEKSNKYSTQSLKKQIEQISIKQSLDSSSLLFHPNIQIIQNTTIRFSQNQIVSILQDLNKSLVKIRDLEAETLICRAIKKLQNKLAQSKQKKNDKQKKFYHQQQSNAK